MMKKVKLLLIALLCVGFMPSAMAQITEGTPSAKTIRTGNRPDAGTFGLYMGATSNMFKSLFDGDVSMEALPLINLKYMTGDQFEVRLGIELYRSNEKLTGTVPTGNNSTMLSDQRYSEGAAMFYPGIAYHFSRHNIFDVYAGAELPFGWNRNTITNIAGTSTTQSSKGSFVIGLGAFVGVQAFIANLPLAIGVEYGLSARLNTSLKYKTIASYDGKTQILYSPDYESFKKLQSDESAGYDRLKAKAGGLGSQFRLTLSYYFK